MSQGGSGEVGRLGVAFTGDTTQLAQAAKEAEQIVEQSTAKMKASANDPAAALWAAKDKARYSSLYPDEAAAAEAARVMDKESEMLRKVKAEAAATGEALELGPNRALYRLGETIDTKTAPAWDRLLKKFRGTITTAFLPLAIAGVFHRLGETIAKVTESSGSKLDKFYAKLNPNNTKEWVEGLQKQLDEINGKIAQMGDEQNGILPFVSQVKHLIVEGETYNGLLEQQAALYEKITVAQRSLNAQTQRDAGDTKKKKVDEDTKKTLEARADAVEKLAALTEEADSAGESEASAILGHTRNTIKEIEKIVGASEDPTIISAAQRAIEAIKNQESREFKRLEAERIESAKKIADEEIAQNKRVYNEKERTMRDFYRSQREAQAEGTMVESFFAGNQGQSFGLANRQRGAIEGQLPSINYQGAE